MEDSINPSWFQLDRHDETDADAAGDGTEPPEGEDGTQDNSTNDGQADADPPGDGGDDHSDQDVSTEPADGKQEKPKTLADLLKLLDPDQRRIISGEVTKARNEAKNLRTRLKTAEDKAGQYDQLLEAKKTEQQRAQEAAEKAAEIARKRAEGLLDRAVRAEVRALASDAFADPEDAAAFLDLSSYAGEDGQVDADAIRADLDDLLSRKPHLAKPAPEPPKPRAPAPNRAQGSSGNGGEQAASFKNADKDAFAAELAKYRLKARS